MTMSEERGMFLISTSHSSTNARHCTFETTQVLQDLAISTSTMDSPCKGNFSVRFQWFPSLLLRCLPNLTTPPSMKKLALRASPDPQLCLSRARSPPTHPWFSGTPLDKRFYRGFKGGLQTAKSLLKRLADPILSV